MRRNIYIVYIICMLASCSKSPSTGEQGWNGGTDDISGFSRPRLFLHDSDFRNLKKGLGNEYAIMLNKQMLKTAEEIVLADEDLMHSPETDASALKTVRNALKRIAAVSYAYNITQEEKYLLRAEKDISTLLDRFDSWTEKRLYSIVASEASLALSIAYDWLYDNLSLQSKSGIEDFLNNKTIKNISDKRLTNISNTSIVNISALICSAIAIYETAPEYCNARIEKAIECARKVMTGLYAPDGIFPESPSYADYANMYLSCGLMALEDVFGTDFGLSESDGFKECGEYFTHIVGNTGDFYNYGDCNSKVYASSALWYLSYRFNQPYLLYGYQDMIAKGKLADNRCLFLAIASARRMKQISVSAPSGHIFSGDGATPLVIARSGWEKTDCYLGLKGGCPSEVGEHAHLDAGAFVYEQDGIRCAVEMDHDDYDIYRESPENVDLGFPISNMQHNTLTVNGKSHDRSSKATIQAVLDTDRQRGGIIDMTSIFRGDLKKAVRQASIIDNNHLEVIDNLSTGNRPAHIRWTMLTRANVTIEEGCIILRSSGKTKVLKTDAPEATYTKWSSNPEDYDSPFASYEKGFEGTICGFEFELKENTNINITTTLW